ncbi:MAG: hypothetical protein E7310_07590 [Clostridiales bacterium]|nr:hypothetical protein [Clostridiales bacterium]
MIEETELAYSEVNAILDLLEEDFANRIPTNIRDFFKKEMDKEYIPNIRTDIGLDEQELKSETISILTLLQINYLCNTEEEKQDILRELSENDKKRESILREKYNPDNIFKNKNNLEKSESCTALVEYKEVNIIKRILNKILSFFKK